MTTTYYTHLDSPLGSLRLLGEDDALVGLQLPDQRHARPLPARCSRDAAAFRDTRAQLAEYFAGQRSAFDLRLAPAGTDFQRRVWSAVRSVPTGSTASYRDVAARIGRPTAARAVGLANGHNPIVVVIPCHRIIGADGSLTGYAGGLAAKRWLLSHEGARP